MIHPGNYFLVYKIVIRLVKICSVVGNFKEMWQRKTWIMTGKSPRDLTIDFLQYWTHSIIRVVNIIKSWVSAILHACIVPGNQTPMRFYSPVSYHNSGFMFFMLKYLLKSVGWSSTFAFLFPLFFWITGSTDFIILQYLFCFLKKEKLTAVQSTGAPLCGH